MEKIKVLFVVNWYSHSGKNGYGARVFHYEQATALKELCDIRLYWPLDSEVNGLVGELENGLFTYRSQ